MALIFNPNADMSKGEPTITYDEYRMDKDGAMIPVIEASDEKPMELGVYAAKHLRFLKEEQPERYTELMLLENTTEYLHNIEIRAQNRKETIIEQQKKALGVTEELKEKDQMKWVGLMNSIIQSAEEIVLAEIVYA
ncbi:MAG: TnpV protein [Acutalibacteraceae bacterium]|nr:TnpV protein [Acutalibacteraceae bacterium]